MPNSDNDQLCKKHGIEFAHGFIKARGHAFKLASIKSIKDEFTPGSTLLCFALFFLPFFAFDTMGHWAWGLLLLPIGVALNGSRVVLDVEGEKERLTVFHGTARETKAVADAIMRRVGTPGA